MTERPHYESLELSEGIACLYPLFQGKNIKNIHLEYLGSFVNSRNTSFRCRHLRLYNFVTRYLFKALYSTPLHIKVKLLYFIVGNRILHYSCGHDMQGFREIWKDDYPN